MSSVAKNINLHDVEQDRLNVAFITAQFFYAFYSSFSQQSIYDSYYLMFYNITMTSLPIFLYSITEQHTSQSSLMNNPASYKEISKNSKLSILNFLKWNSLALWHAFVSFFGVIFLFGNDVSLWPSGQLMGNWTFGSIIYTVCVLTANFKLCLETHFFSAVLFGGFAFAGIGNFVMTLIYSSFFWPDLLLNHQDFYKTYLTMFSSGTVWFGMLILVAISLVPDFLLRATRDVGKQIRNYRQMRPHSDSTLPLRETQLSPLETKKFLPTHLMTDRAPSPIISRGSYSTHL